GYVETLEVLYSSSDDNTESFVTLDETKLLSAGWKSFEYELPEDARYFAIRYKGNTDESSFVMIDDIEYTPVNDSPRLEGYDIYRNGVEVAEMTWASGEYLDRDGDQDTEYYQIGPVVRRDGTLVRGMISNKAYVRMSGVTETAYKNSTESEYYTLQGLRVKTPEKGVIIKKNGTKTTKILKK
ncbi:MAG: choice-of-anchor J domain-containing protein, partial [Muribaculaceae bacterium]|nr:choice-of-anchor J domain-containing protein [Muribaculaceae bacterium]